MGKVFGKTKARLRKATQKKKQVRIQKYHTELCSKIRKFNDPCLSLESEAVNLSDNLFFIGEMERILAVSKHGVGLAAPQIGILKRVCVIRPDIQIRRFKVLINPEIVEHDENVYIDMEGCLSYPKTYCKIERYLFIVVKYTDVKGKLQKEKFSGFPGRIVQHELEHFSMGECQVGKYWSSLTPDILMIK